MKEDGMMYSCCLYVNVLFLTGIGIIHQLKKNNLVMDEIVNVDDD